MKQSMNISILIIIIIGLLPAAILAEETGQSLDKSLKGLSFGVLAYLDYSHGTMALPADESKDYSSFSLTRGYLTVRKELLPWMGMRMTLDTTQDDSGDYKMRLKYLYAELDHAGGGFFTGLKAELGLGHMPWLDFEEHINPYRCQGTMASERAGVFNSADLGISLRGNFGPELTDAQARTGSHSYSGKWGSWHLGLYNGGGYHAAEKNTDKVLEGRVTLRPLPGPLPGLQVSALAIRGKGNVVEEEDGPEAPDYNVYLGMISFEHPRVIVTAQYFTTEGNAKGDWIDDGSEALKTEGYSLFGKVRLPLLDDRLSFWARYDHFNANADDQVSGAEDAAYDMLITSLAYDFYKGNMLLLVYENTDYGQDSGGKKKGPSPRYMLGDESKIQTVWQVKF